MPFIFLQQAKKNPELISDYMLKWLHFERELSILMASLSDYALVAGLKPIHYAVNPNFLVVI